MENKSLYQITVEEQNLFNQIEALDGELTPELEKALELNKENFDTKIRGCIWRNKKQKDELEAAKKEKERVEKVIKRLENSIADMENRMLVAVEIFGGVKQIDTFTLSIKETKSTDIFDAELIPAKFKITETVTTTKIPKDEIKKAINAGEEVPGARIQTNKTLQIK
jgi:hypothetical protein